MFRTIVTKVDTNISPYTPIANEYYDALRHPTCANFDDLSRKFLVPRIRRLLRGTRSIIEVGAGRSIVAPIVSEVHSRLDGVVLLDISPAMLSHSSRWEDLGARLVLADARHSELPSKAFGLLVSSLGDPYNVDEFCFEAQRVLNVNRMCLFTTPAAEWAEWFPPTSQKADAEFVLADGSRIDVPSYVPSAEEQISMIERAGFEVEEVKSYFARDITGPISSKLVAPGRLENSLPLLRGFTALRLP